MSVRVGDCYGQYQEDLIFGTIAIEVPEKTVGQGFPQVLEHASLHQARQ